MTNPYYRYYSSQIGGGPLPFPVFRGSNYQSGAGIGNIFRSIARFFLPIIAPVASTFIRSAAGGLEEGKTLKEAAKSAIGPSLRQAGEATTSQILSRVQGGSGRRRRKRIVGAARKARAGVRRKTIARGRKRGRRVYKGKPKRRLASTLCKLSTLNF